MTRLSALLRCDRGAAAAEMALVLPLLLVLLFGAFELGNYFRDWHTLSKAVRDGARFAARHDFADYSCAGGTADTTRVVDPTKNVVRTGLAGGNQDLLSNWDSANFTLTVACSTSVVTGTDATTGAEIRETLSGIYRGASAPVVTVTVRLPYRSLLGQFGWSGVGLNIAATEQAAVMGV
jgi:Flp pilus assembly protein TadG